MDQKVLREISRKLSLAIVLLGRRDEEITKNIDSVLDFFEDFGVLSNQDIAMILNVSPQAVANAKSKRKTGRKKK